MFSTSVRLVSLVHIAVGWMTAAVIGCAKHDLPVEPPDPILEVMARPLAWGDTGRRHDVRSCVVGNEERPARGCRPNIRLEPVGPGAPNDFAVPGHLRGKTVALRRWIDPPRKQDPTVELAPLFEPRLQARVRVPFPEGVEGRRRVAAVPVKRGAVSFRSEPILVPEGAVLRGAFAVDPATSTASGPAIRFQIGVRGRATPLLSRTLERDVGARKWHGYSIDLAEVAGERVVLWFRAQADSAIGSKERSGGVFSVATLLRPAKVDAERVILISLDTLRADHVGAYGATLPLTPNIDRLAERGRVFETAMTTFTTTTASHMSLFTGLYPAVHQVVGPTMALAPAVRTLPQYLAAHGFETGAVTENGMLIGGSGFSRGFDSYTEYRDATLLQTSGHVDQVVDSAIDWLSSRRDQKTFMFLHTYQVHGPYSPPPDFDRFRDVETGLPQKKASRAYAGEVLFTDHEIGRLFEDLRGTGLLDRTLVIITADHGEGFGRKSIGHGSSLDEAAVRIPLIWFGPGRVVAGRTPELVSLVDVLPTLLDYLGVALTHEVQGRSAAAALRGGELPAGRPIFVEGGPLMAVRRDDSKWIRNDRREKTEVFLVGSGDPLEREDVATPQLVAEGHALLDRFRADAEGLRERLLDGRAPASNEVARDVQGQLRALGYVE